VECATNEPFYKTTTDALMKKPKRFILYFKGCIVYIAGASSVPSMGESVEGSVLEGTPSISVNVSYTTTNSASGFDKEDSLIVTTFSTSNCSLQANSSQIQQTSSISCTTSPGTIRGLDGPLDESTTMMSQFPFHTMNVHLQRGKNLVAKDACGKMRFYCQSFSYFFSFPKIPKFQQFQHSHIMPAQ